MLARPLPATPFMSAAGLPLVIVGTLSVMIAVDSGDGQGGGGGVVRWAGEPWESGRGLLSIKVRKGVEWGAGDLSCQKVKLHS